MKLKIISRTGKVAIYSDLTHLMEKDKELLIVTERYKGTREENEISIKFIAEYTIYDDTFKEIQHRIIPTPDVTVEPTEVERVKEDEVRLSEETEG